MPNIDPDDKEQITSYISFLRKTRPDMDNDAILQAVAHSTGAKIRRPLSETASPQVAPSYDPARAGREQAENIKYGNIMEGKKSDMELLKQGSLMAVGGMVGGMGGRLAGGAAVRAAKPLLNKIPYIGRGAEILGPAAGAGAGEAAGTYATGRASGLSHDEAKIAALASGVLGGIAEGAANVTGRIGGAAGYVGKDTMDELMSTSRGGALERGAKRLAGKAGVQSSDRPTAVELTRNVSDVEPRTLAERNIGQIADFEQQNVPQLRNPAADLLETQPELLAAKAAQRTARESAYKAQVQIQQEMVKIRQQTAKGAVSRELAEERVVTAGQKKAANLARSESISTWSRNLDDSLNEAERRLTGGAQGKSELLQAAADKGVVVSGDELVQYALSLVPDGATTGPRIAAGKRLRDFVDNVVAKYGVKQEYGGVGGIEHGAKVRVQMNPVEADNVLRDIRAMVGGFGDIDQTQISKNFSKLSHFWRSKLYDSISGTGAMAAEAKAMLDAQEGLRGYMSAKDPSAFVSRIVAGGPGARDRLVALRAYESTHQTGGLFEQSIDDISRVYGDRLRAIGGEAQAATDAVNLRYQKQTRGFTRENYAAKEKLDIQKQADLDRIDAGFDKKLNDLQIKQYLQRGKMRSAFEMQESTAVERSKFEVAQKLRQHMAIDADHPSKFVDKFRSGNIDSDALNALRDFEDMAGTGGKMERDLKTMAMRKELTKGDSIRVGRMFYMLERFLARPAARFLGRNKGVIGGAASATSNIIFPWWIAGESGETEEKKKNPYLSGNVP